MKKAALLLTVVCCLVFTLVGCDSGNYKANKNNYVYSDENATINDGQIETKSKTESINVSERKIITTINISLETKNFDDLVKSLETKVSDAGGYIETSSISNNSYYGSGTRSAEYKLRIPASKSETVTDFLDENSNITQKNINTDDVTLNYVDTESRVKALQSEKEALEELLKKATTTSDIISIRDQLTNVIYEIESYQSQLRTYDNQVQYTTINVQISEVERITPAESKSTFETIGDNLANGFANVWNFLVNAFVFVISSIPYLLLIAAFSVVAVLLVNLIFKRKKNKKQRKNNEPDNK